MTVTIYFNPKCGTARKTLELIRQHGIEPEIVEYLKTPLTRPQLEDLIKKLGIPVRDLVRTKESLYSELGLEQADDNALLDAMAAHPILMNRPVVITPKGARLCRPQELVLDLLP